MGRALGRPWNLLGAGFLLGLLSGSGTGFSLLALGLLEGGFCPLARRPSWPFRPPPGPPSGWGWWPWPRGLAELFLAVGLPFFLVRGTRSLGLFLLGLGVLFWGFLEMGRGAQGLSSLLMLLHLPSGVWYLAGLLLAFLLGTANGVAALALALLPVLGLPGGMALALGAGVGTSGALFWAALAGRPEALALGATLLLHRLVFSLPFLLLLPRLEGLGVVGLHLVSHLAYALAFAFLSRPYGAWAGRLFPSAR